MKEAANALGAKTARACDSCLRRRARWFCAADDAFLCHVCDNLVHSANQLASRHERVRLQTASSRPPQQQQAWYSGFTRKARTPRHNNKYKEEREAVFMTSISNTLSVVPEMATEEEETEELLLCRVPEFDPDDLENFPEFLGSDMDLAEFAADVESLLEVGGFGVGEDESVGAQELFGFDCKQENNRDDATMVLMKNEIKDEQVVIEGEIDNNNNNTSTGEMERIQNLKGEWSSASGIKGKIFLRLNYEEVISAWDSEAQGCPWTTGNPPELNSQLDLFCLGWSGDMNNVEEWGYGHKQIEAAGGGGGREARVSRYREKRRTRLFAKKIRYQVRKLNAEKRPRMKGRFVKRASFLPTPTPAA